MREGGPPKRGEEKNQSKRDGDEKKEENVDDSSQGSALPTPMLTIDWNCRELRRSGTARALSDLVGSHKPEIMGLVETKFNSKDWEHLQIRAGFDYYFVVDRRGLSGGLALSGTLRRRFQLFCILGTITMQW